jgi:hypothetical protein
VPFLRPKQTAAPTSPHPAAICTLTGNRTSRDSRRQHGHRTRHAAHNRTLRPYASTSCPEAEARLHAQRAQHARQQRCSRPTCSRMPHASGALAARYARPAGTQGVEGSVPVWHAPRPGTQIPPHGRLGTVCRALPCGGRTDVAEYRRHTSVPP